MGKPGRSYPFSTRTKDRQNSDTFFLYPTRFTPYKTAYIHVIVTHHKTKKSFVTTVRTAVWQYINSVTNGSVTFPEALSCAWTDILQDIEKKQAKEYAKKQAEQDELAENAEQEETEKLQQFIIQIHQATVEWYNRLMPQRFSNFKQTDGASSLVTLQYLLSHPDEQQRTLDMVQLYVAAELIVAQEKLEETVENGAPANQERQENQGDDTVFKSDEVRYRQLTEDIAEAYNALLPIVKRIEALGKEGSKSPEAISDKRLRNRGGTEL